MATVTMHTTPHFSEIVSDPSALSDEPTIAGIRVPVCAVVLMYRMHGDDLSCVRQSLSTLTEPDIYRALGHYERRRREILGYMRKNCVDENFIC